MKMDQYALNAYRSNSSKASGNVDNSAQPLVHKPVFERLDSSALHSKAKEEEIQRKTEENARLASETGTWFEKKEVTEEDVTKSVDNLISKGLLKVTVPEPSAPESIYRRVAKFLMVIGMDEAAKILPHLTQEQTERIIPEIARISHISEEEKKSVLDEFSALLEKARESGGVETARTMLVKAYGKEKGEELLKRSVQFPEGRPFDFLQDAAADRVLILLQGESTAVKALVLSQLESAKAAAVINLMKMQEKKEVVLRLSKMSRVTPDVLEQTAKALQDKLMTQNTESSDRLDGKSVLAEILRRMPADSEDSIIRTLSETDPDLGSDLRERLFTQEDIIGCDDRYLQNVLHQMNDNDIAALIHGKDEGFRNKILGDVSKSRAQIILSEERLTPQFYKSDCERITGSFFATLRRAWERGELRIEGRDDGEEYV